MKFKLRLKNIFNILFILVFVYILKVSIFNVTSFRRLSPSIILIISIFLLLIYLFFRERLNNIPFKYILVINSILFLLLLVIQIIIAKELSVDPGWDFGAVANSAKSIALSGDTDYWWYFANYPNNLGATIFLTLVYKLTIILGISIDNYIKVGIFINIVVIDLSLILSFILLFIHKGEKVATLFTFSIIFITPLYMYTPIFYTDTLSMIYPIILFIFYHLYKNRNKIIYIILGSIFIAIGVLIKPNVIISLIALFIYSYLTDKLKGYYKVIFVGILSLILVNTTFNLYLKNKYMFDVTKNGFPSTHWIMMGLKGDGGYNPDDVEFTLNTDPKQRKDENIRVIKERLKDYKLSGLIHHFDKKIKYTWADGTLNAPGKLRQYPLNTGNYLDEYIYGGKSEVYLYISGASFSLTILGVLISALSSLIDKKHINIQDLFNISIFGVFLFLLMWETRSRYILCLLPIMMMSSTIGVDYLYNIIFTKVKLIASKKRDD